MSRLRAAFGVGRPALVGYLPAGFPDHAGAVDALTAMVAAGVDVVEVGLPYSDPLLDGIAIQEAVNRALAEGATTASTLQTVEAVAALGVPVVCMTYWNPVERYGVDSFARDLAAAGGAGLVTPDLVPEEAAPWLAAAATHGLDPVFLVAPASTDARITRVCEVAGGFVYAAATMGVTGAQATPGLARELVARVRPRTDLPVAVGIGVSTAEQALDVAEFADGVIVGSAFVRTLLAGGGSLEAGRLASTLADAVHGH